MTHDERFDRIDAHMERMSAYIQDFRSEAIDRLAVIENRLDGLSATVANIDARFPALTKLMLDAGSFATRQVKEQARLKASDADLASRVAKLEETIAKLLNPAGHRCKRLRLKAEAQLVASQSPFLS